MFHWVWAEACLWRIPPANPVTGREEEIMYSSCTELLASVRATQARQRGLKCPADWGLSKLRATWHLCQRRIQWSGRRLQPCTQTASECWHQEEHRPCCQQQKELQGNIYKTSKENKLYCGSMRKAYGLTESGSCLRRRKMVQRILRTLPAFQGFPQMSI